MKKIIFLFLAIAFLTSCEKSKKEILEENIATYIKKGANIPESYEPVETNILETVYIGDYANAVLSVNNEELESKKKFVSAIENSNDEKKINAAKKTVENEKILIKELELENKKLEKRLKSKRVAFIKVEHTCNLKNKAGKAVEQHFYVLTDDDYNIKLFKIKNKKNILQTLEYFKKNIIK